MKRLIGLALVLIMLLGMAPSLALAQSTETKGGKNVSSSAASPSQPPAASDKLGTVEIVKSGYLNAYTSNDKRSGIVFRVHHGERFLCTDVTDDGWYGIEFIDGTVGYVLQADTALERGVTDAVTLSSAKTAGIFKIRTNKKSVVYSQPRAKAQSKRETADGHYTFHFNAGSEMTAFGKTFRENKEWYVMLIAGQGSNNIPEIVWLLADDCEVLEGNPDGNIIPDWWYD